jgi:signal transduction histidine kinase
VHAAIVNGRSVLAVEDDGAGVPGAVEHAIFDRNVSTAGSTGLGLSLARALVEADGGRLILARPRPPRFEIIVPQRRG